MVESLYGVDHAAVYLGREVDLRYSLGLLERLISLPPGASVGIEYAKELGAERPGGIYLRNIRYWQELENLCEDLGLHPAYLDDPESCERLIKLSKKENLLTKRLKRHLEHGGNPQKTRKLREALFKAETERRYLNDVEREDKIIGNILRYQPQVVIVGQVHGDLIMLDLEELRTLGLAVGYYFQENLDPNSIWISTEEDIEARTILKPGIPNPLFLREKETTIRQYYAARLGRVLPDSKLKPDFIGTWNPDCRPQGLFEMYVDKSSGTEFSGIIEDTAGTASFEGKLTDDSMEFLKRYDPLKSFQGFGGDIKYLGHMKRGVFVGTFQAEREIYPGMKPNPFYVNPGDKLEDCEID